MENNIEFWQWLIIGVVFLVLEVFAPGAIFMWFGFSGLLTGLITWLIPEMSIGSQILLFSVSTVISIFAWRLFHKKNPEPESPDPDLNNRLHTYIGQVHSLTHPIVDGKGRLHLGDGTWTVQGPDLPAGRKVKIVGVKGIQFVVEPVD